jgi:hypothetical protein
MTRVEKKVAGACYNGMMISGLPDEDRRVWYAPLSAITG